MFAIEQIKRMNADEAKKRTAEARKRQSERGISKHLDDVMEMIETASYRGQSVIQIPSRIPDAAVPQLHRMLTDRGYTVDGREVSW